MMLSYFFRKENSKIKKKNPDYILFPMLLSWMNKRYWVLNSGHFFTSTLFAKSHEIKKLKDLGKYCKLLLVFLHHSVEFQRVLVACNLPSMVIVF